MTDDFDRAVEVLEEAESIALACHVGPDGDALGSMLGLAQILAGRGIHTAAGFPSPFEVPPHYAFLPGIDRLLAPSDYPKNPEVVVTFDCGSLDRLGDLAPSAEAARHVIVIDHHKSNTRFGDINLVDPDVAASAMLVYRMAKARGWPIDRDAATCLYTGIATDTGRFQFRNTDAEVFRAAAELAETGIAIDVISRTVFEEHRYDFMRFIGRVLTRCELDRERNLVVGWFDQADLAYFGVAVAETETVIDFIRQAQEAEVALLVKETEEGSFKVSLRSLGRIDVAVICSAMGGGGHRMAAGYTSNHDLTGTIAEVKAALDGAPLLEQPVG